MEGKAEEDENLALLLGCAMSGFGGFGEILVRIRVYSPSILVKGAPICTLHSLVALYLDDLSHEVQCSRPWNLLKRSYLNKKRKLMMFPLLY